MDSAAPKLTVASNPVEEAIINNSDVQRAKYALEQRQAEQARISFFNILHRECLPSELDRKAEDEARIKHLLDSEIEGA